MQRTEISSSHRVTHYFGALHLGVVNGELLQILVRLCRNESLEYGKVSLVLYLFSRPKVGLSIFDLKKEATNWLPLF